MSSQKIKIEEARRLKTGAQTVIVLDATARKVIHILINAIREKLNELSLPENKREALFNKLNVFAAEVDRDRTRTEAFLSFVVDIGRASRELNDESCLSGYHPHPLYVVCLLGLQARAGAGALRRRSG